jgi:hypothetical protein
MSSALLRRLAPLSLFLVPLLIPVLVVAANAAVPKKHHHHKKHTAATAAAKAGTTAKVATKTTTTTAKAATTATVSMAIPSAARGVRFGTSLGTNSATTLRLFPRPDVLRIFWSSPKAQLPSMPSTAALWVSFKSLPSASSFAGILQAWNKSGRTVYWTYHHEADRPGQISATKFRSGWASLLAVEKRYPSTHVKSMSIFTGIMLAPNHPHGNPESWYVNADILGFDCYVPASVPRAMAYAKAKHKSWAIPEFGADNGDAGNVKYIQSTIAQWAAYPPVGASWYNNTAAASFSQPLSRLPKTTSYLKTLAAAY